MKKDIFLPANILLPKGKNFESWSVVACDQFSSDKEYWNRVSEKTSGKSSTYHMIVPEAFLEGISMVDAAKERNEAMTQYCEAGVFEEFPASFIYVEREITGGKTRHGLVGVIDLDAYEYTPGNTAPIRASENTVVDRLPPRISVRENAVLELPHVMMLIDDPDLTVIEPLAKVKNELPKLYDFELMENGGNIKGWQVSGEMAEKLMDAIRAIDKPLPFVIGDGNHSLAAAKCCWNKIREETGVQDHPARYALVELNNVYDEGVEFEPIHRVIFDTNTEKFIAELTEKYNGNDGWEIEYFVCDNSGKVFIPAANIGSLIDQLQHFLEDFAAKNGGVIDYIHDNAAVMEFVKTEGTVGLLLPGMSKADLFETVEGNGVFPKKSFSIGHAKDKRYYLECRKIKV